MRGDVYQILFGVNNDVLFQIIEIPIAFSKSLTLRISKVIIFTV